MNINVQKIELVVIKDSTGQVVDTFELCALSTTKMSGGAIHLELIKRKLQ